VANTVTIIDYGIGNLLSVCRAFEYCGATVNLSSNTHEIATAERLVLPGVGAFGLAMQKLRDNALVEPIHAFANTERPLLGICLGMQLLLDRSTEFGDTPGLGLIAGEVLAIPKTTHNGITLKIPNIGWHELHASQSNRNWCGTVLENTNQAMSVYFVHSYHAKVTNSHHELASICYGDTPLAAVINDAGITGCQFHPEKSSTVGLTIIKQFIKI